MYNDKNEDIIDKYRRTKAMSLGAAYLIITIILIVVVLYSII